MPSLEDILKAKGMNFDSLSDLAEKAGFKKAATNPMSASDIDSINSDPATLERFNRSMQGDFSKGAPVAPASITPSDPMVGADSEMNPFHSPDITPSKFSDSPVQGASHAEDIDEVLQAQNRMDKAAALTAAEGSSNPTLADMYKYIQESKLGQAGGEALSKIGKAGSILGKVAEPLAAYGASKDFVKNLGADTESMDGREYGNHLAHQVGNAAEVAGGTLGTLGTIAGSTAGAIVSGAAMPLLATGGMIKLAADHPLSTEAASAGAMGRFGNPDGLDSNPEYVPQHDGNPLSEKELAALSGPNSSQNILAKAPADAAVASKSDDSDDDSDDDTTDGSTKKVATSGAKKDMRLAATGNAEKQAIESMLASGMNNGGFTNNTVDNLKAVQDEADRRKNQSDMMKAVNQISAGLTGKAFSTAAPSTAAADKFQDDQKAEADSTVKQFQDLTEKEKDDPNSAASVNMRKVAGIAADSLGFKVPPNLSYNQLKDIIPGIERFATAKDNRESKSADLAEKYAELNQRSKYLNTLKDASMADKMAKALKDDLDADKGRAGNFGKSKAVLNAADRVNGLFEQFPDYNIPKANTTELATAVAGMISGGSPQSQHQIEQLVPDTLKGQTADAWSKWVTGNPQGREQQAFMRSLQDTTNREKAVAQQQIDATRVARLSAHGQFKKLYPDAYNDVVRSYGLPVDGENQKQLTNLTTNGGSSAEMVRVVSPEGQSGSIPKSSLKAAMDRGFR